MCEVTDRATAAMRNRHMFVRLLRNAYGEEKIKFIKQIQEIGVDEETIKQFEGLRLYEATLKEASEQIQLLEDILGIQKKGVNRNFNA